MIRSEERDTAPETTQGRWGESGALGRPLCLLLALLSVAPVLPFLRAGLLAEDAAILGRVHRSGPLADWLGPQYGMRIVRFWRPLVTDTWWLGERVVGTSALGHRALNLALQAALALALASLALGLFPLGRDGARWGGARLAAIAAGLFAAFFPWQGGTVLWLAGRTDLLVSVLLLLAVRAALRDRPGWAFGLTLCACASKEFGFAAPAWALLLGLAARLPRRLLLRATLATGFAAVLAFAIRAAALGTPWGGYAGSPPPDAPGLFQGLRVLFSSDPSALVWLGGCALLAWSAGTLSGRLALAGLALWLGGFVPLLPLAADGVLEEANLRLLLVPELGLALVLASCLAQAPRRPRLVPALLGCMLLLLSLRAVPAFRSNRAWAASAARAQRVEADARRLVEAESASERPVLLRGIPATWAGAYCLNWGFADRLREPFPRSPRPVWPFRPLFEGGRLPRTARPLDDDGALWPWRGRAHVPELEVVWRGSERTASGDERLALRRDLLEPGEVGDVRVAWTSGTALGAVVYTELGTHSALLPGPAAGGAFSLRDVLAGSDGVATLAQALLQVADTGASRAYLELRALDAGGELVAASSWLELTWDEALAESFLAD